MNGVLYSIHGRRFWERLVVSLWTCRRYYQGPIIIQTLDAEGASIAEKLVADGRLGDLSFLECEANINQRSGGYAAKPSAVARLGTTFDKGVFLDADTLVVGPFFEELLPQGDRTCTLTQFAGWTTQTPRIRDRVLKWQAVAPESVARTLGEVLPAINTGVYGFDRTGDFFTRAWAAMTARNPRSFICDEIAAQLLVCEGLGIRILDDRFNFSPIYGVAKADVRIYHFHGDKHLRAGLARSVWLPEYEECRRQNVAGIAEWGIEHQHLPPESQA